METGTIIAVIGWVATAFTLASFLMSQMFWLRIFNLSACIIWITYGLLQMDWPVITTNGVIALIHLVWFYKNKFAPSQSSIDHQSQN